MLDVMIYLTMNTATPNRLLLFTVLSDDAMECLSSMFQIIPCSFSACFSRLDYTDALCAVTISLE